MTAVAECRSSFHAAPASSARWGRGPEFPRFSITLGSDAVLGRVPVAEFVEVARVDDVPPSTVTVVHAGAVELALVNVDGTFYAVGNECPHRGGFLGEGEINSDWHQWALECPLHASVFDVRTGEVLNPPAREAVRTYDVSVDQGIVRVAVD